MPERDLNYRYSLQERRSGEGGKRRKEREREWERMGSKEGPTGPSAVITGCARTFQESDSRQNSRVTGQSCPRLLLFDLSCPSILLSLHTHTHTHKHTLLFKYFSINQFDKSSLRTRESRKLLSQFILGWNSDFIETLLRLCERSKIYVGRRTHRNVPCNTSVTNCPKRRKVVNQRALGRVPSRLWGVRAQLNRKTRVMH